MALRAAATIASAASWLGTSMSSPLYLDSLASNSGGLPGVQHGVDGPVFRRIERADLPLALHDQAQRHGLHAPGGKPAAHLVPQQRRNLVAHQAVQHAARLLRVHQVGIHLPRMLERGANRLGRDLVEHHAEDLLRIGRRRFLSSALFGSASSSALPLPAAPFFLNGVGAGSCSVNLLGLASTMARCAEMASPSRSGSPAR